LFLCNPLNSILNMIILSYFLKERLFQNFIDILYYLSLLMNLYMVHYDMVYFIVYESGERYLWVIFG
ncbi:MAG TPA: hypothetical protein PK705_07130, partial [Clostridia bacterium]|nr:hypothetical protein [Clostridia bacterium]